MANNLKSNPIIIDTWTSDIELTGKDVPMIIRNIRLLSAADGDIFNLENAQGTKVFEMTQTGAGDVVEASFHDDGFKFTGGLNIDVSACTGIAAGDIVWIYLK